MTNNKFSNVRGDVKFTIEPFVQFIFHAGGGGFALFVRPYRSLSLGSVDCYNANMALNPITFFNDPLDIPGKLKGFGMSVMIADFERD